MGISTEELFLRYAEETNILSNEESDVVVIFGSRATDDYKPESDLDVFVIIPEGKGYYKRKQRYIDGILVETMAMSKDAFRRYLKTDLINKKTFYESILTNGIVKKDNNNFVNKALTVIHECKTDNKQYHDLDPEWISQLDEFLYLYHSSNDGEKMYHYYEFIEYLRLVYLYMNDLPETVDSITYDLYTDENKAERYMVELPSREFIECFIKAMKPTDMDESIKELSSFIGYKDYREENKTVVVQEKHQKCSLFEDARDTFTNLLYIAKGVDKVESRLIKNSYDADYLYYNLLHYVYSKYLDSPYVDEKLFKEKFSLALDAFDMDSRINIVEEIFHVFNKGKNFDYCDYSL